MPRAFTEAERERIKGKLIAAGKRLINKAGLRHFVVDEAAREAGISKGSFYSFFPSREDFILSVLESWESEYRGALIRGITEGGGTPRERIEKFFLGAFQILEHEPGLARLRATEIQAVIDRLPPERIEAHQAMDNRVLKETFGGWISQGLAPRGLLDALRGLIPALFSIVLYRDGFPPGTYQPAVRLIAEALALRISSGAERRG